MDIWSKDKRSEVMSKIRSKDTKPERMLRSALHQHGFRFRIHRKDLPGKPDIVLPKYRTVIFVHGCYWHFHKDCREGHIPFTNSTFWKEKLEKNVAKDEQHRLALESLGWRVIEIWECTLNSKAKFAETLELLIAKIRFVHYS